MLLEGLLTWTRPIMTCPSPATKVGLVLCRITTQTYNVVLPAFYIFDASAKLEETLE
jgi:hypothetical protein